MTWSVVAPNLLIGLREGLEAGLVVTILLGAVRRLAPQRSLAGVWVGVASAAMLSLSFGAVLTFTRAELSPRAQELFGGATSLLAVVLVTSMVFWMRRAARGVAGELRGKVSQALVAGGPALAVTAFIAVAREGLETALFVWTNAQAADASTSPLLGALAGLLLAAALCTLLYRRVLKINLGRFFTVTGAVLLVVVAGVLGYGIGDLQDVGMLAGHGNVAFDVSAHISNGSWWYEALRGVTNIETRMSWLQVLAYVAYLAVTLPLFLRPPRPASDSAAQPAPTSAARPESSAEPEPASTSTGSSAGPPAGAAPVSVAAVTGSIAAPSPAAAQTEPGSTVGSRMSRRSRRVGAVSAVLIPTVAAGVWVALDARSPASGGTKLTVTASQCAEGWAAPPAGASSYAITNSSGHAADVELVQSGSNAVIAEIELLAPGTTRSVSARLGAGDVRWRCVYEGLPTAVSASRTVREAGTAPQQTRVLVRTTAADLAPVLTRYRLFVATTLATLKSQIAALQARVSAGGRAAAERAWRSAHLSYHRIGAAYDAFGPAGDAVDGLAQGLPDGARDPGFVGFHQIERDLWSGRPLLRVATEVRALAAAVTALDAKLPRFTLEANAVTIRAHEIVEDTLRFTLTGQDDYGSGSGFATAQADLDGTRYLIGLLRPLLEVRSPGITAALAADMRTLQRALSAAAGTAVKAAPTAVRQRVNAATGALLETLAPVPDLLEIRSN